MDLPKRLQNIIYDTRDDNVGRNNLIGYIIK